MKRIIIILLSILMIFSAMGCSSNQPNNGNTKPSNENNEVNNDVSVDEEQNTNHETLTDDPTIDLPVEFDNNSLSYQQINSIVMLNYLSVLTENIMLSPNNRLILENSYSTLYNNIFPNSVDKETQTQITNLMRTINSLEMNDTKRNRIQYLYDQGQAQAMRSAIPSPMAILNVVQSDNPLKAIVSVASLSLNSYTGYQSAVSAAEFQFLQSNWEIEDNEKRYLDNARIDAFNYLMDIVRDNELPGELSLNANVIDAYLEKKNSDNVYRNLQFLETNQETYKAYYGYWLFLADMYYKTGNYEKCLEAFQNYERMNVRIFQRNHDLAEVLPSIICSSQEVLSGDELITFEEKCGKMLMDNASVYVKKKGKIESKNDWVLKYFAIQTYIDLYSKTQDESYLQTAYKWTWTVIDELIDIQREKNIEYINDLVLKNEKEGTKEEKSEAKEYNSILKNNRKVELPPVYEPLLMNCQLLFAIADELGLSSTEKEKVDKILHPDGEKLFLSESIDSLFWMNKKSTYDYGVTVDKNLTSIDLCISANALGSSSTIEAIYNGIHYNDWEIKEVDRNKSKEVSQFKAIFQSKSFNKAKYDNDDIIEVLIKPCEGEEAIVIKFKVKKSLLSTKFEII